MERLCYTFVFFVVLGNVRVFSYSKESGVSELINVVRDGNLEGSSDVYQPEHPYFLEDPKSEHAGGRIKRSPAPPTGKKNGKPQQNPADSRVGSNSGAASGTYQQRAVNSAGSSFARGNSESKFQECAAVVRKYMRQGQSCKLAVASAIQERPDLRPYFNQLPRPPC